jgi:hypothetical protein
MNVKMYILSGIKNEKQEFYSIFFAYTGAILVFTGDGIALKEIDFMIYICIQNATSEFLKVILVCLEGIADV